MNILIVLAVIGAGISPACKFIAGGQTWLEICGAEGIKKILIASEDVPDTEHQEHVNADPCAFCLTHASVKVMAAQAVIVPAPVLHTSSPEFFQPQAAFATWHSRATYPRGPPAIL